MSLSSIQSASASAALIPAVTAGSPSSSKDSPLVKHKYLAGVITLSIFDENVSSFLIKYITPKDAACLRLCCRSLNGKYGSEKYYRLAAHILGWDIPAQVKMPDLRTKFIAFYARVPKMNNSALNALPSSALDKMRKNAKDPLHFNRSLHQYVNNHNNQYSLMRELRLQWKNFNAGQAGKGNIERMVDIAIVIDHEKIADKIVDKEDPTKFLAYIKQATSKSAPQKNNNPPQA